MEIVLRAKIKGRVKRVLIGLGSHADDDGGNCFPKIKTLAAEVGDSEFTVQRALADAVADGFVVRWARYLPNGGRTSDGYRLDLDAIAKAGPSPQNAGHPPERNAGDHPQQDADYPPQHNGGDKEPSVERLIEPSVKRSPPAPRPRKSVPLPNGWKSSDADRRFIHEVLGLDDAQIDYQEHEFREFWHANGSGKANWSLAFRNRVADQVARYGAGKLPRKQSSAPSTASTYYRLVDGTPQCEAWRAYYTANPTPSHQFRLREMASCFAKRAPFPAPSEWPPDHQ